jgi:hypothetical protein
MSVTKYPRITSEQLLKLKAQTVGGTLAMRGSMQLVVTCSLVLAIAGGIAHGQGVDEKLVEVGISVGCELIKGIGSRLVDKGLDYYWTKEVQPDLRVAELQSQLSAYESGLRRIDTKIADEVAALRKDVTTRTTAEDVRRIVRQTLEELEKRTGQLAARTKELEGRQDLVEARVRKIEELFGYIPTVQPAPLLVTASAEARTPTAHPLIVEWMKLLVRSERSRRNLQELSQTLQPTSRSLKAEQAKDREIVAESRKLHGDVLRELAAKLPERQAVLMEYKPGTREVREVDEGLASLTWLAAVTRPVSDGPYADRLGVPNQLFGNDAPEILRAFELANVDRAQLVELYRQHFLAAASMRPFLGISVRRDRFSPAMLEAADQIVRLAVRAIDLTSKAPDIESRLEKARAEYADDSPQVNAVRDEQRAVLTQAKGLHGELDVAFGKAFGVYLDALKIERPTNSRMTSFRQGVLIPSIAWLDWLESRKDSNSEAPSWRGFLSHHWGVVDLEVRKDTNFDRALCFSPDGSRLVQKASGVTIWSTKTGKVILSTTFRGYEDNITAYALNSDGSLVAGTNRDGAIRFWSTDTGELVLTRPKQQGEGIYQISFSRVGDRLATGVDNEPIRIWDSTGAKLKSSLFGVHEKVYRLVFSPDGSRLACMHPKGVTVWDVVTRKFLCDLSGSDRGGGFAFSPDGRRIAIPTEKALRIVDVSDQQDLQTIETGGWFLPDVVFTPQGLFFATSTSNRPKSAIEIWDAATREVISTVSLAKVSVQYLYAKFSPDGARVAVWGHDGGVDPELKIFDIAELVTRSSASKK